MTREISHGMKSWLLAHSEAWEKTIGGVKD